MGIDNFNRTFLQELIRPRFWPLILALTTVLLMLAVLERFIDDIPDFLPQEFTNADAGDFFNSIAYDLARLRHEPHISGEPRVFIIGGSVVRRGVENEMEVQKTLTARLGYPVQFAKLAGVFDRSIETLAIVANLPVDKNTVVYVSTTALMFETYRNAGNIQAFESLYCASRIPFMDMTAAHDFIVRHGGEISCPLNIMRHRISIGYYLAQRLNNGTLFKVIPAAHEMTESSADKMTYVAPAPQGALSTGNSISGGLSSLHVELVRALKNSIETRGGHLVFVYMPNAISESRLPEFLTTCFNRENIEYVNLDLPAYDLDSKNFADAYHLNARGRKKFSPIFINMILYHLNLFKIYAQTPH